MNDRFMFRLPFYNNKGEFSHFEFILIGESLPAYNVGVMHHNNEYEQCTGLKDKNGNLIYESDIIKDRGGIIYKIQRKNASFFAVALDNFDYLPDCYLVQEWLNTWKAEIIGNVHEQAEQKE